MPTGEPASSPLGFKRRQAFCHEGQEDSAEAAGARGWPSLAQDPGLHGVSVESQSFGQQVAGEDGSPESGVLASGPGPHSGKSLSFAESRISVRWSEISRHSHKLRAQVLCRVMAAQAQISAHGDSGLPALPDISTGGAASKGVRGPFPLPVPDVHSAHWQGHLFLEIPLIPRGNLHGVGLGDGVSAVPSPAGTG